eukprot:gene12781-14092_t
MTAYRKGVWFIKGLREYTKKGYDAAAKNFEPLDGIDLSGRAFMITGANSGIGKETAIEVAKRGGVVHMICRNQERGLAAQEEIKSKAPDSSKVYLHILDMSNAHNVAKFAKQFIADCYPLHVLVNNAGCMVNQREVTAENLEKNFATNTFGTYLLTRELVGHLKKHESPRVITVTSGGMLLQKLNHDDLQLEKMNPFDGAMAYAQNKRQQVVMTDFWAKMHKEIHFSTMHPGWADTPAVRSSMPEFHSRMGNRLRSAAEGADTLVWLCISPDATKEPSGSFFQDRKSVKKHLPLAWTAASCEDKDIFMKKLEDITSSMEL